MSEIAKIKGYDIRDKKLADATSQSSVASTDAIRMKTSGGDEVYIARDSFVDAIASVFKSNSKSTITTLFGEQTSGNTSSIGSINMSNLASVLGEPIGVKHYEYTNVAPGATIDIPKPKCCIAILWEKYLGNDTSLVYCGNYAEFTTLAGSNWVSIYELSCGTGYIRLKNKHPTINGRFYITVIY